MRSESPRIIRFGRAICGDLVQAERREWWLANGRGAYAAGTIAGSLTRCYHGLLIAPVDPPLGRRLVWAKADAELVEGERSWPLFTNRWAGGTISPAGQVHIESFHLDGTVPVWLFSVGSVRLEARIWLEPGADTAYAAWRLLPSGEEKARGLWLRVRLMINDRDHHGQTSAGQFAPAIEVENDGELRVRRPGFALTFRACGGSIAAAQQWIENFDLPVERHRGLPDRDNHLQVAEARLHLIAGQWVGIVGSLERDPSADLAAALDRRRWWQRQVLDTAKRVPEMAVPSDWIAQLLLAADSFIFSRPLPGRPGGKSVIAGYPWFGDWGRDTMISLPGLTLATGREEWARDILLTFASFVDRAVLPNVFPGAGDKPDYNTADATLWFFEAWRAYVEESGDRETLAEVFPVLAEIVERHIEGTRFGIGVDPADGLLRAGEYGVQLTWMDAKVGDWVVTPRIGKPVEVNALWFNALCVMADFAEMLGRSADPYRSLTERVRLGFARFADEQSGGLYDVIDGPAGDDGAIRPNQIFAVSLPHSPLSPEWQKRIVTLCGERLLTSYGIRSLEPGHPDYKPHYGGDPWQRDGAYHQGTVWAWLLGHYAVAEYRAFGDAHRALQRLAVIRDHLFDAGLGTISEVFEGEPPHLPVGAPSQAWSVACVIEAWWRLQRVIAASTR